MTITKQFLYISFLMIPLILNTSCSSENEITDYYSEIVSKEYSVPFDGGKIKFKFNWSNPKQSKVTIKLKQFDSSKNKRDKVEYTFEELGINCFTELSPCLSGGILQEVPFLRRFSEKYLVEKIKEENNEFGAFLEFNSKTIYIIKDCSDSDWECFANKIGARILTEPTNACCTIL